MTGNKLFLLKHGLPVAVALFCIVFAALIVTGPTEGSDGPAVAPPSAADDLGPVVAGLGIIEPSSETIDVASPLPGIAEEVLVLAGAKVERGTPLFRLEARDVLARKRTLESQLEASRVRIEAAIAAMQAREAGAKAAEAGLVEAKLGADEARLRAEKLDSVGDIRAVSTDERDTARIMAERAIAAAERAHQISLQAAAESKAALVAVKEAEAAAGEVQARLAEIETTLERLIVRAPVSGTVLRVNVRPGEYVPVGALSTPILSIGVTEPLHVRVQIDEEDAWRVKPSAGAVGSLRGNAAEKAALDFVRFEPLAQPKRNLNGGAERVDTRVIEVIYKLDPAKLAAFVGQQVDVFIAAPSATQAGGG